jgi:hypothetical protein
MLLANLRNERGRGKIDCVLIRINDSQREAKVLSAGDRKVVVGGTHALQRKQR